MLKLEKVVKLTALQLHQRYEWQATAMAKQFPLLMSGLWLGSDNMKPEDSVADVLKQGTLGIGFIGLAECLVALTGKHHAESDASQRLGIAIVSEIRDLANQASEKYQHNYSVLATPAEGLAGKFTKRDRQDFGVIAGVTDKDYYTNSNHVPVGFKCTAQHKAEVEAPYHALTLGGHIFYVELDGDATHNPTAIMRIVDLMDKYNIGYASANHNRCRCMQCGHEWADRTATTCPKCGSDDINILARVTGYLTTDVRKWNHGKQAEWEDRVTHSGLPTDHTKTEHDHGC